MSTQSDSAPFEVKPTHTYLTYLVIGSFFPCATLALVATFFLLDPLHTFFSQIGLADSSTIPFFLLFAPMTILMNSLLLIYFAAQKIILTKDAFVIQRLFSKKSIPLNSIVDFSRRYYYGSPFEQVVSASIAKTFRMPITNGIVLELWYKDDKKIHYLSQNLSYYQDSEYIFSQIAEAIEIPEKFDKHPRSYSFYISHHKLYSLIVFFMSSFLLLFVFWSYFHQEDIKVLLLIPFIFTYYYFSRSFFGRT